VEVHNYLGADGSVVDSSRAAAGYSVTKFTYDAVGRLRSVNDPQRDLPWVRDSESSGAHVLTEE
jgi:YD repeat-containing protein